MSEHTHPAAVNVHASGCEACEDEMDAYMEAQDLAEGAAYIRHYGIASYVARLRYEEEMDKAYAACRVASFYDDPITRSASFDGYEMAGMTRPIREADARDGCVLCQQELNSLDEAWGRANY